MQKGYPLGMAAFRRRCSCGADRGHAREAICAWVYVAAEEIHDNDLRTPPTDDGKIKPMYGSTPKELFHAVHMDVSLAIDPTKSSPERVYTHRVPHKTRQEEKKKTTSWKTFLRG